MRFFSLFLFSLAAQAQTGLDMPRAGLMLDRSGALREVSGIAQSFVVGDPLRTGVLSAACARSLCVVKTATSLTTQDANDPGTPAPAGPALFSIHSQAALVYFRVVNQFAHLEASELRMLNWSLEGEVLALRGALEDPQFAVRRTDGVWIIALDGSIQSALPVETVAVLLLEGVTLYSLSDSVVLRRSDGSELSFPLPGVVSLSQLGENYVQASTDRATYSLRIDSGREQVSLLPELGLGGVSQ